MPEELLVDVDTFETRIALVDDGDLVELHVERSDARSQVGNIHLGTVDRVAPSVQAAFVDIGAVRPGFLPFPRRAEGAAPDVPWREGQRVAVQVAKDPLNGKGLRLTAELSLAGRHAVLTPFDASVAVSRRIDDDAERTRLADLAAAGLESLGLPHGCIAAHGRGRRRCTTAVRRPRASGRRLATHLPALGLRRATDVDPRRAADGPARGARSRRPRNRGHRGRRPRRPGTACGLRLRHVGASAAGASLRRRTRHVRRLRRGDRDSPRLAAQRAAARRRPSARRAHTRLDDHRRQQRARRAARPISKPPPWPPTCRRRKPFPANCGGATSAASSSSTSSTCTTPRIEKP